MCPFHPVYLLELGKVHVRIQLLEFGRRFVLCEFEIPVCRRHRRQAPGDRAPFCDAETSFDQ